MNKGLLSTRHILKFMNIIGILIGEYCPVVRDFGGRWVGSNHGYSRVSCVTLDSYSTSSELQFRHL